MPCIFLLTLFITSMGHLFSGASARQEEVLRRKGAVRSSKSEHRSYSPEQMTILSMFLRIVMPHNPLSFPQEAFEI